MPTPNIDARPMPVACFAPPLTDEKLAAYSALSESQPEGVLKHFLKQLLAAVLKWWELPESTRRGQELALRHRGKNVAVPVTPLEEEHVAALWDSVPFHEELNAAQSAFDAIPGEEKELRDCAFHMLWYVRELCHDREPLDQSKLPG